MASPLVVGGADNILLALEPLLHVATAVLVIADVPVAAHCSVRDATGNSATPAQSTKNGSMSIAGLPPRCVIVHGPDVVLRMTAAIPTELVTQCSFSWPHLAESPQQTVVAESSSEWTKDAHASTRWARAVVGGIDAASDPRTLSEWGRSIGASYGALRNWCSTARISPRRSLAFLRVLRALVRRGDNQCVPAEELLDIVDRRTMRKLLKLGVPGRPESDTLPTDVQSFLATQNWVRNVNAIENIERFLSTRSQVASAHLANCRDRGIPTRRDAVASGHV